MTHVPKACGARSRSRRGGKARSPRTFKRSDEPRPNGRVLSFSKSIWPTVAALNESGGEHTGRPLERFEYAALLTGRLLCRRRADRHVRVTIAAQRPARHQARRHLGLSSPRRSDVETRAFPRNQEEGAFDVFLYLALGILCLGDLMGMRKDRVDGRTVAT